MIEENMEIEFNYQDVRYTVAHEAVITNHIRLPNGVILSVGYWVETYPEYPEDLTVVHPSNITRYTDAFVVEKADK